MGVFNTFLPYYETCVYLRVSGNFITDRNPLTDKKKMKNYIFIVFTVLCLNVKAQTLKDCSTCATQLIKSEKINDLSIDEIRLLTNEIFARNGYQFENSRFQNFFEEKSWYQSKNNNKSVVYNEIEKKNIKLFQDKTKELKNKQQALVNQLKNFKNLVINDKKEELKTKFGFNYENQIGDDESNWLKEVFNKINIDDINYYKNNGLNSTTTDNGFVKIVYEVSIENENVNIYYNYMTHSKIIKNFDAFTDYHSEEEFMYNWQFEFKNDRLKFVRLAIAG